MFSFALVYVGTCLRWLSGKSLGAGKDDLAANERAVVLGIEPGHRRARIARQLSRSGLVHLPERYCVPAPSQRPVGPPRRGLQDKRLAGRRRLRQRPASVSAPQGRRPPFPANWHRDRGKTRRKAPGREAFGRGLAAAPSLRPAAEPVQQQHQMQHNQVEPALDRIGNPVIGVKRHRTGLRHDGAIEGMDCTGLGIAPKPR